MRTPMQDGGANTNANSNGPKWQWMNIYYICVVCCFCCVASVVDSAVSVSFFIGFATHDESYFV